MISERRLKNWRREALFTKQSLKDEDVRNSNEMLALASLSERILKLTRDLLDIHLLKKEK